MLNQFNKAKETDVFERLRPRPFMLCRQTNDHVNEVFERDEERGMIKGKLVDLKLDYIQSMTFCSKLAHELSTRKIDRNSFGDFLYILDEVYQNTKVDRMRFR